MEINLFRDAEILCEQRLLPADIYNLTRILLDSHGMNPVFVPIRGMQCLAIIDPFEIVFVESSRQNLIALSWTDFNPHLRSKLTDSVPYVLRVYQADPTLNLSRLQSEFALALNMFAGKQSRPATATLLKFRSHT